MVLISKLFRLYYSFQMYQNICINVYIKKNTMLNPTFNHIKCNKKQNVFEYFEPYVPTIPKTRLTYIYELQINKTTHVHNNAIKCFENGKTSKNI